MKLNRWKRIVVGASFFSLSVVFLAGCGSSGNTCTLDFADSSSQQICDNQASAAGCSLPANWSATTQFCSADGCTEGCPSNGGHTD